MTEIEKTEIQVVPDSFTLGEFTFIKERREGRVAIYRQTLSKSGRNIAFETVVIREQQPCSKVMGGVEVKFAHKELYPTDSQWGKLGWSYINLKNAKDQMDKVLADIAAGKKF